MRLTFLNLLKSASARRGLDYGAGQVSTAEAQATAEALNECVGIVWNFYPWPWTCFLYNSGQVTPAFCSFGDRILAAYIEDPEAAWAAGRRPEEIEFIVTADLPALLIENAATPVYYQYQRGARFTAEAYAGATTYRAGEAVFYANSCWRANITVPATGTAIGVPGVAAAWVEQLVPLELEQTLLAGVQQWFASSDGAPVSAAALRAAMQDRMEDALRSLTEMQGQYGAGRPAHR